MFVLNRLQILLVIFFLLFISHNSFLFSAEEPIYNGLGTGTHYWIDGKNGNDENNGTKEKPWRSILQLESIKYKPGDLVHIMKGQYHFKGMIALNGVSGNEKAWVCIQAEGAVTIKSADSKGCSSVIMFLDCHYIVIKGLTVTHEGENDIMGFRFWSKPSDHVALDGCTIKNLKSNGFGGSANGNHIIVNKCIFSNLPLGIYWGYYEDEHRKIYFDSCKIINSLFIDCPKTDSAETGYGIQIKGGSFDNLIQDNVFYNVSGTTRAAIGVYHISKLDKNKTLEKRDAPNIIRGNFIYNCRGEGIYACEGAIIENNILVNCKSSGIATYRRKSDWGSFYGNLIVRNNTIFQQNSDLGPGIKIGDDSFEGPFLFLNNLILTSDPNKIVLEIPENFHGLCKENEIYGQKNNPQNGIITLKDLTLVQSINFGEKNFLFPSFNIKPICLSRENSALTDFNGGLRISKIIGAYGDSISGENMGWVLTNTLKPIK